MVSGVNGNDESSEYMYNGLGFLVNTIRLSANGLTITDYVIDYTSLYQRVLAKYEDGGLTYKNVFGLDRISTEIINQLEPVNTLKTYIQNDRLGSGRYASNAAGELVGFTDLDVWGNVLEKVLPTVGEVQVDILNNFTNHEFDEVLGVYYAKARFYDPVTSRMLSPDPHWGPHNRIYGDIPGNIIMPDIYAMRQSDNLYAYVMNNPVRFTDPSGYLTPSQYPEFLWHFAAEGARITVSNLSRYSIWRARENFEQIQGLFSTGVALATGEIALGDLISAIGRDIWDGLSGNLRYLITNYHLFDPCLELSSDEVRDLAHRTAGAYEEIVQFGALIYSAVRIAKGIVASRTARNLAQGSSNITPSKYYMVGTDHSLASRASRTPHLPRFHDVVIHGSSDTFAVFHGGRWIEIGPRSLVTFLKKYTTYRGGNIRLLSCHVGIGSVAQELANILDVNVLAPTGKLLFDKLGVMTLDLTIFNTPARWLFFVPQIS